jgi:hypothetical protein
MFKKLALLVAVIAGSFAASAHAQPYERTWVSATGTNNSQCSVTQPCQTFAQALAVTLSDGEINCLTPGGFGGSVGITISMSVTIDCEAASNGGISVTNGAAITINGTNAVVNLIGLDITGNRNEDAGPGVFIQSAAAVTIRKCKIYGFRPNGGVVPDGIEFSSGGSLTLVDTYLSNNTTAIFQTGTSISNMVVRNSTITNNTEGIQVDSTAHAGATIEQSTLAFNVLGLNLVNSTAVGLLGGSTVSNNTTGVQTTNGATLYSFGNNQIGGNSTDISGTITSYPGGLK